MNELLKGELPGKVEEMQKNRKSKEMAKDVMSNQVLQQIKDENVKEKTLKTHVDPVVKNPFPEDEKKLLEKMANEQKQKEQQKK